MHCGMWIIYFPQFLLSLDTQRVKSTHKKMNLKKLFKVLLPKKLNLLSVQQQLWERLSGLVEILELIQWTSLNWTSPFQAQLSFLMMLTEISKWDTPCYTRAYRCPFCSDQGKHIFCSNSMQPQMMKCFSTFWKPVPFTQALGPISLTCAFQSVYGYCCINLLLFTILILMEPCFS